jgi:Leucine-rich repeat (LRR) protein
MPNYYDILGITTNASEDDIRTAYKNLVKAYHPDVNPTAESEEIIKHLNTAYDTLSDPHKRMLYDLALQSNAQPSPVVDPEKVRLRKEKKAQEALAEKKRDRSILIKMMMGVFTLALIISAGVYWLSQNYIQPAPIVNLSQRGISKIPYGLEGSAVVNILYLHHNHLTVLPPEIGSLPNLMELTVSHNQLTTLPPEIANLKKLVSLNVASNRITQLPIEIGQMTSLTELYLSQNPIRHLPVKALSSLPHLKVLDIRGCPIPMEEVVALQEELPYLRIVQ